MKYHIFPDFDSLPDDAYVRAPMVCFLYGISLATMWRWIAAGSIPKGYKIGPNTTAWRVGELRASLASKSAA